MGTTKRIGVQASPPASELKQGETTVPTSKRMIKPEYQLAQPTEHHCNLIKRQFETRPTPTKIPRLPILSIWARMRSTRGKSCPLKKAPSGFQQRIRRQPTLRSNQFLLIRHRSQHPTPQKLDSSSPMTLILCSSSECGP